MRTVAVSAIVLAVATLNVAICQTQAPSSGPVSNGGPKNQPPKVFTPRQFVTEEVRHLMSSATPMTNLNVPLLRRMGDGAAVEIAAIMKTRGPLTKNEQQNVVEMLHKAFESPEAITIQSNQKTPTASFALLDQIAATASAATVATRDIAFENSIANTKQFIVYAAAWHRIG